MAYEPDPTLRATAARPARPEADADRPQRIPAAALLNTGALPATTALPAVTEPKLPPYFGD